MTKPKALPGARVELAEDVEGRVESISWNGYCWLYSICWWNDGSLNNGVFYEREFRKI